MKKYLILFAMLLGSITALKAQGDQPPGDNPAKRQETLKAMYVAYVTQQLNLNPEEAQKFWPVHAQFESELKAVNKEQPELDKQQAILNIKKRYQENFNKILGPNRCEHFFRLDGEFKRKLLDHVRNQAAQRPKFRRMQ